MRCGECGTDNDAGRKFCRECGTAMVVGCPSCGAGNTPGDKFCGECGAPLIPEHATRAREADPARLHAAPAAERRLVSVLFADLVGFTTLSESRDSEEVRELLTRYFDTCRTLITRYGGVVEKFIGDAVMAVWGTPVATEHDAERAVRAALDLTSAVHSLGDEVGAGLAARVGVLTGEAAVTIGAEGQGMVAGDLVNTASRIQSIAEPGCVLVGETTKRSTESAVVYEDAGEHELKGKAEPMSLWRATRVVSGALGAMKSEGLEAPFVGRDRELRVIKDLFHASAEEDKAHLVSVVGVAGTGKSRLSWEFFKYIDGVAFDVRWHRGRCLPYGEGVAFWALAEMVRTRFGILEGEDPASARAKLEESVTEVFPDAEERRWVEPRLAVLLGLEEAGGPDLEGLFAAWRLFYERLAEEMPTVMIFEDLQWADAALLDFVEYLMEWSKSSRLFVVTLARPELADRRPTWGAGGRNFTSMYLEPLPLSAMEGLLAGLVPGLPEDLRAQILERAEGVPLYAVETVRMLLDRGLLVQAGASYAPTGPIETLDVPEGLHAVIAARLDGLSEQERRLVQDASVLGKIFRRDGIKALSGVAGDELDDVLASLVRKEVLGVQSDLSPERGQYGFLQDLVRRVAYDTLSKRERKQKHLAAAAFIESAWGPDEEEFVEVVAAHCLEAHRLAPDDEDADEIRAKARAMLARAGERAASIAAPAEAQRYFEEAAELTDGVERAEFLEQAGIMAARAGRSPEAIERFESAARLLEDAGLTHPAARVSARAAGLMWQGGRLSEAVGRMDAAFSVLVDEGADADLAALAAELGRLLFFSGQPEPALERIEWALRAAEALRLPETLAQALTTKAVILYSTHGRMQEGRALLRHALEVALESDAQSAALRAYFNLADLAACSGHFREAADHVARGLALSRRIGNRFQEWLFLGQSYGAYLLGEWDEVLAAADAMPPEAPSQSRVAAGTFLLLVPLIHIARGDLEAARAGMRRYPDVASSADVQETATEAAGRAALLCADGRYEAGLSAATEALDLKQDLGLNHEALQEAYVVAAEAASSLRDPAAMERILRIVDDEPAGTRPQYLEAHAMRLRARIGGRAGELETAEDGLREAAGLFRELEATFWTAVAELELAERLTAWGRADEAAPLLRRAGDMFERLGAKPWLQRVETLAPARAEAGT